MPDSLTLTVKSLKPALTFTITAQTTDTISHLKTLVSQASSSAPSPDSQRLLLKGKALADTKLVKEYSIPDGATLTLMVKASTAGTSTPPAPAAAAATPSPGPSGPRPPAPSLTITTELEGAKSEPVTDANIDVPPSGPQPQVSSAAFHGTISDPKFWQRIHALCVAEFVLEDDADAAWETFLVSMKSRLSAGEAAKIRDVVGVNGELMPNLTTVDADSRHGRRCIDLRGPREGLYEYVCERRLYPCIDRSSLCGLEGRLPQSGNSRRKGCRHSARGVRSAPFLMRARVTLLLC